MWNNVAVNQAGNLALQEQATSSDIYETFFEPDVMLPSQFHDADQDGLLGGERRLMAAILSDGIEAYLNDKSQAVRELSSPKAASNVIALKSFRSEAIDWVDTVSRNQLPLIPPCSPGLSRSMTTVNGVPDMRLKIPFNCQLPTICDSNPEVAYFCPRPNGRDQTP